MNEAELRTTIQQLRRLLIAIVKQLGGELRVHHKSLMNVAPNDMLVSLDNPRERCCDLTVVEG